MPFKCQIRQVNQKLNIFLEVLEMWAPLWFELPYFANLTTSLSLALDENPITEVKFVPSRLQAGRTIDGAKIQTYKIDIVAWESKFDWYDE